MATAIYKRHSYKRADFLETLGPSGCVLTTRFKTIAKNASNC